MTSGSLGSSLSLSTAYDRISALALVVPAETKQQSEPKSARSFAGVEAAVTGLSDMAAAEAPAVAELVDSQCTEAAAVAVELESFPDDSDPGIR